MRLDTIESIRYVAPVPRGRRSSRLAVLAVLAVAAACGRKPAAPPAPQPVVTVTLRPQPTSLTQEYPAQLEASNTVESRPQVAGILYRQGGPGGDPGQGGTGAVG